jgi:hypothetical protein
LNTAEHFQPLELKPRNQTLHRTLQVVVVVVSENQLSCKTRQLLLARATIEALQ